MRELLEGVGKRVEIRLSLIANKLLLITTVVVRCALTGLDLSRDLMCQHTEVSSRK